MLEQIKIPQGVISFMQAADFADIVDVEIDESLRGQGFGTLLMQEFLVKMRERSVGEVTLEVRVDNLAAIKLYEKVGFVAVGVRKGYYKGIDGILMRLELV